MKDSYRPLLEKSRLHLAKGEVAAAIPYVQEALKLEPDDAFLWEELFKLRMVAGEAEEALSVAFELRRIDADNANYVYMHGIASLVAGQVEAAATLLEDTLRRAPGAQEARRALAQTYQLLGQPERVRELLEEAVERNPTDPAAVNDLAVHLMGQGAEGKRRAEPLLRRVLKAHPGDLATHLNLALALAERDAAAARQHASRAVRSTEQEIREQAQRLLSLLGG